MNLPNAITIARILIAPLIAALPFINSPFARIAGFLAFIIAAVSDYFDGMLARTRNLETDLGRLLDPLADKLLLFATLIPMFVLMSPATDWLAPGKGSFDAAHSFPFITPFGNVGLPWWIVAIVLGRELFIYVKNSAYKDNPAVRAFVDFFVEKEAEVAEAALFIGLTPDQKTKAQEELGSLVG